MGEGVERGRVKIGESCLMLMFVSGQQGQVSDVSTCMHILWTDRYNWTKNISDLPLNL